MSDIEQKSINHPDQSRSLPRSETRRVTFADGTTVTHFVFKPGWRWDACALPHYFYVLSGRLALKLPDLPEQVIGPGDVAYVPPSPVHDAWVVGDEPFVAIDFWPAELARTFGRPSDEEFQRQNQRYRDDAEG